MSLTSFIKIPEVKALFRNEFPLRQTRLEGNIKTSPVTKNYPLVGTAFDYLFRFFLEQKNPNCVTKPWVAEGALALLEESIEKSTNTVPQYVMQASDKMTLCLEDARENYYSYMDSGEITDGLIESSIILAQMDALYRSGHIHPELGKANTGDVQDLRNLISLVNPKIFQAKNACYLNPTFGYGSELVGGADADLIVDDTLIDIKTTKFLSFTQEQYNQLIGYYILAKLGKINGKIDVPISRIGIYFSLHGILHTISADEIEGNPGFSKFVRVFEKLADAVFTEKE